LVALPTADFDQLLVNISIAHLVVDSSNPLLV
jgi:hypothetical protein